MTAGAGHKGGRNGWRRVGLKSENAEKGGRVVGSARTRKRGRKRRIRGVISLEITPVSGGNVSEGRGPASRAVIIIWESHSTAAGRSSRINRVVVFIESPLLALMRRRRRK